MKKRLRDVPEALVSPEAGDTQTSDSAETTSEPQSTTQVESVELNQGLCNAHIYSYYYSSYLYCFTTCNLCNQFSFTACTGDQLYSVYTIWLLVLYIYCSDVF